MNIKLIKRKAEDLLFDNPKAEMFKKIILITALIAAVPNMITGLGQTGSFIRGALSILLLSIGHGVIVSAIKITRNNSESVVEDDAYVGIYQFKRLFPTYFVMNLIQAGIALLLMVIFGIIFYATFASIINTVIAVLATATDAETIVYTIMNALMTSNAALYILVFVGIVMFVTIYVSLSLFAVPYLLEQYGMTNTIAVGQSFKLMKGHRFELFMLQLSFILWIFLEAVVLGLISSLLQGILGNTLANIIATLVSIAFATYTFAPKYELSRAIFFEELAYYQYEAGSEHIEGIY